MNNILEWSMLLWSSSSSCQKTYDPVVFILNIKSLKWSCIHPAQMAIASAVHLYVFPAKPYELMGDRFPGSVSVLGDYASVDCPLDPDEVRDSERPTKLRLPTPDIDKGGMTIRESVRDVFIGGGEYVSVLLDC